MKKRKSAEILKDQIDEMQSNVPVTNGMTLKEIAVLIVFMLIGFCIFAVYKQIS